MEISVTSNQHVTFFDKIINLSVENRAFELFHPSPYYFSLSIFFKPISFIAVKELKKNLLGAFPGVYNSVAIKSHLSILSMALEVEGRAAKSNKKKWSKRSIR